jgi:hypothetical protein
MLGSVIREYESLLDHPATTPETVLNTDEMRDRIKECRTFRQIRQQNLPILNNNVHYQARLPSDYTPKELERDKRRFKRLQHSIRCQDCHSTLYSKDADVYDAQAVSCKCDGKIWWYYDAGSSELSIVTPND